LEHVAAGRSVEASAALEEAIRSYVAGFEADPRDYYPGVNAITLSLLDDSEEAPARVRRFMPVVAFAVARRGALASNDYWDVATTFELAVVEQDWPTSRRAAGRLVLLGSESWMLRTTLKNLELIKSGLKQRGQDTQTLDQLAETLERRAAE